MDETRAWGEIALVSGWRGHDEQVKIYNDSLEANGAEFTSKYVAVPGHSEHQTGLAVDLALEQPDIDFIRPYFPYTGVCGNLRSKAGRFGLIERYPKGKEEITGISHEPWHFRYVGAPHASIMEETGDVLEEYHEKLKQYPYGSEPLRRDFGDLNIEIFYIAADKAHVTFEIEDNSVYTVSGNNTDGFVITVFDRNKCIV